MNRIWAASPEFEVRSVKLEGLELYSMALTRRLESAAFRHLKEFQFSKFKILSSYKVVTL